MSDWREKRDEAVEAAKRVATQRYVCNECGASGVKLWRQYQTFADNLRLLCKDCAEKDQKEKFTEESDSLGWLVPAVPTALPDADGNIPEDETFWGYTSVPGWGCKWWWELPPEIPRSKYVDVTKFLTREQEEEQKRERQRTDDERTEQKIKETFYVVDATHEEQLMLWQQWNQVVEWVQDGMGLMRCAGKFGGAEVWVTMFWYTINGKRVGFYEATSMVTHHDMIEDWVKETFPQCFKEGRWRKTNAANFSHCISDVAPDWNKDPVAKARFDLNWATHCGSVDEIVAKVLALTEAVRDKGEENGRQQRQPTTVRASSGSRRSDSG